MSSKKAKWIALIICCVVLLILVLFISWCLGWIRYPLRLLKTQEHLHLENEEYVELLFPDQAYPCRVEITNDEAVHEILVYLNSLKLIQEELTEDEMIYDPDDTYDKDFYIWFSEDSLFFSAEYMFAGHNDECDDIGTNYYFYDSGLPFGARGESAYEFFQNLLEKYADEDGIVIS